MSLTNATASEWPEGVHPTLIRQQGGKGIEFNAALVEAFLTLYLKPELASPQDTPPFHRVAWNMVTSTHPQVALAAPRGHAKSTGITLAYTLTALLFRVFDFPVIVSNTQAKATEFVRNLKSVLTENVEIRNAFQVKGFEKETEDDFICILGNGYKFRVMAIGFGMSVRGLNWGTRRPNAVLCDDMEDDEQVMSFERRDKAKNWFLAALLPATQRGGVIRVVGTIMHADSLLQNFISDDESWWSRVWEAHDEEFGNILWPEMYDAEYFRKLRKQFVRQGKLDRYNMEYRNRAVDTTSGLFRKANFLPMNDADWKLLKEHDADWPHAIGADFAYTVQQRRDYTCFVRGVIGPEYLYIINVIRRRMTPDEICTVMFEEEETARLQGGGRQPTWFPEKGAISTVLTVALELLQQRKRIYLNMIPMSPGTTDKRTRATPYMARHNAKAVKYDKEADWYPDFEQELLEFDRGTHDDQVDAAAHLVSGVQSQLGVPMNVEEEEEEEYFVKRRQTVVQGGRNKTTGY